MQVDPENHPSFRKHLLSEGFMDKIQMPPAFVKEHKKMLGKTCILKTDVDEMLWEMKIVRENSNYFICGGDWPHFVGYNKLEVGEILIFYLINTSTFQVLPYAQKSCKNLRGGKPFEELSSSENEEDVGPSRRAKKVKMDPVVLSDSEEENIDPSGGGNSSYSLPGFIMKVGKSDVKADNMIAVKKNAPETKKTKNVKMEPIELLDSKEEIVDPSGDSKDGGNPCYSHPGHKSDAKADNMLCVKKRSPESKKAKKVKKEVVELSDSEEEDIDPSSGSKDGRNPCYSHPGGKFDAKADSMLGLRKKAPETKKAKKVAKDPNKPKRPACAFFVFLEEFRKQFKEENRGIKPVAAFSRAGGDKWKQLSDAEKAPYMAEAKKRMAEYKKSKDAYNRRVAAGSAEEVESGKSTSDVDEEEESGEEEGDDD